MFGLLDSHTQSTGHTNMRVDNYVYTEEALREAHQRLKPDGILVLKFAIGEPWIWMGQRLSTMLAHEFGQMPIVYSPKIDDWQTTVFITSDDPALWERASQPALASIVAENPPSFDLTTDGSLPLPTDDWPYIYHRDRTIPRTYLTVSLILLVIAAVFVHRMIRLDAIRLRNFSTWHFFFLGAAFLLMETQLVSRLALYFGSTWIVNSITITTILVVLIAASIFVYFARPKTIHLGIFYALLMTALLINFFFPWGALPYPTHTVGLLLSLAYALPIFCAGVIFTETFRRSQNHAHALGANIIGAVAGGLTQNLAFIIGSKALLLVALGFYILSAVSHRLGAKSSSTSDL